MTCQEIFDFLLLRILNFSTISLKVDICDTWICLFLWLKKYFRMDIIIGNWTDCRAILVWNYNCDFKSNSHSLNFKITRMTSDQIALHSLTLILIIIIYYCSLPLASVSPSSLHKVPTICTICRWHYCWVSPDVMAAMLVYS